MGTAPNPAVEQQPWKDPAQASIPKIRTGQLAAVYYGQRRSGDFYDFIRVNRERVLFGLFDVAGDLQRTRPVMNALQQCFREIGASLLAPVGNNEIDALLQLWVDLNSAVMKAAGGVHSCPAFLGCYNDELKTLSYANSGHVPGLFREGKSVRELAATALPLGLFSHSVPDASVIGLSEGAAILLVSKGIVEAKRRSEEFGLDGAKRYFEEIGFETAHETCVGLLARVRQFMGTAPTHNDVTAVALVRAL
jgi:sigma-B regulation protein RsbU (phosphoserine phosphatase)